ncbi:hypothetical protein [Gracilibacillus saliphilus]|uniref:hypothetical protein n=1 Tax=Gracilibacillus saliphilus TaxID=543890 RepID=UPI0013D7D95D|nr:hypothetical protein [Gracilibacillus saliphilus]
MKIYKFINGGLVKVVKAESLEKAVNQFLHEMSEEKEIQEKYLNMSIDRVLDIISKSNFQDTLFELIRKNDKDNFVEMMFMLDDYQTNWMIKENGEIIKG